MDIRPVQRLQRTLLSKETETQPTHFREVCRFDLRRTCLRRRKDKGKHWMRIECNRVYMHCITTEYRKIKKQKWNRSCPRKEVFCCVFSLNGRTLCFIWGLMFQCRNNEEINTLASDVLWNSLRGRVDFLPMLSEGGKFGWYRLTALLFPCCCCDEQLCLPLWWWSWTWSSMFAVTPCIPSLGKSIPNTAIL